MNEQQPVLVTTERRGVFFGYLASEVTRETVTIAKARCCVKWVNTRGFLGLTEDGPNERCRIGPPTEELQLFGITSVAKVTDKAVEKWEAAPWS